MELFRRYYDDEQLQAVLQSQPDWGVSVRTVGHNIHLPSAAYPDRQHPGPYCFDWSKGRVLNEFQLVYITNGNGVFEAEGGGEKEIEAGTVFLLYPGVWHRYKPSENTGWEEFWVGFQGHYADYLMKQRCFGPPSPLIHVGFNAGMLKTFIQLIETVKYEGSAYFQLSSSLVTQLLAMTYSLATAAGAHHQSRDNVIQKAQYKILEDFPMDINLQTLACDLNVSYAWFRKAFKDTVGVSPGQYRLAVRMEKACKLLKETDLAVNEISAHLGFESEFYFSRIFKKKMGMPPIQYRKG